MHGPHRPFTSESYRPAAAVCRSFSDAAADAPYRPTTARNEIPWRLKEATALLSAQMVRGRRMNKC
jgi:hypothetical protein